LSSPQLYNWKFWRGKGPELLALPIIVIKIIHFSHENYIPSTVKDWRDDGIYWLVLAVRKYELGSRWSFSRWSLLTSSVLRQLPIFLWICQPRLSIRFFFEKYPFYPIFFDDQLASWRSNGQFFTGLSNR
jgi:hypothetical protein